MGRRVPVSLPALSPNALGSRRASAVLRAVSTPGHRRLPCPGLAHTSQCGVVCAAVEEWLLLGEVGLHGRGPGRQW